MLQRAARRLNPLWAYREEKARKLHPGSLQDEQWGWVYAQRGCPQVPTSTRHHPLSSGPLTTHGVSQTTWIPTTQA
jgi:hypothetical protein